MSATDGEQISVSGKVKSVTDEDFTLSLGQQEIAVEMGDYDDYNAQVLRTGDQVTVTGKMDKSFYENRSIEANSVYIDKLNRYVFANPADEEAGYYCSYLHRDPAEDDEWVSVTGIVVSKEYENLAIYTGFNTLKVDTRSLVGDEATPQVDVGDRASV